MSRGLLVHCSKFNYTSKRDKNQYTALTLSVLTDSQNPFLEIFVSAEFNAYAPKIISSYDEYAKNSKVLGSAVSIEYDISGKLIKNISYEEVENFSFVYDSLVEVLGNG